jgi:hypothetical protein
LLGSLSLTEGPKALPLATCKDHRVMLNGQPP